MMSFEPLWKTMKAKNVSCYALIFKHNFSWGLIDKLKHDRNVTLETVKRLCRILAGLDWKVVQKNLVE